MMGELKKMRTEKKMTQQQVADLVGISLRLINHMRMMRKNKEV